VFHRLGVAAGIGRDHRERHRHALEHGVAHAFGDGCVEHRVRRAVLLDDLVTRSAADEVHDVVEPEIARDFAQICFECAIADDGVRHVDTRVTDERDCLERELVALPPRETTD
jgi:hypothetical protein